MLGLLLAQYTFTGYDASAHMTEETRDAAVAGPRGIVTSIVVSLLAGWVLLIGITFAIQDYSGEVGATVPPAQIFIDAIGGTGAKLLLLIVIVAQLFCGMSSVTANSRMIYAFSRDGAVPGSRDLASHQRQDPDPDQRDLAGGGRGADPGAAVPVEQHRLRGGDLDRGDRPVRRVCAADVPAAAARVGVPAGAVAPGAVVAADRDHRVRVGGRSSRCCSCCRPSTRSTSTTSTTPCSRGRRDRLRRHLLARLRPQVVHRPPGTGLGR